MVAGGYDWIGAPRALGFANIELVGEPDLPLALARRPPTRGAELWWLGQAGFLIATAGKRIAIDPYLSDSLALKYAGTRFPHRRMFPAPILPEQLVGLDWLVCTHAHSDHMDPGTLPPLLAANPGMRVVAPTAALDTARQRGVPSDRLSGIDAHETLNLGGVLLTALPAAHETLERDAAGHHKFLGYIFNGGGVNIYHSGDTVPFDGLDSMLRDARIDLALLPVNGRDADRASNGVPGNLTLDEAVTLSEKACIGTLLGHHIEMFPFNTLDRSQGEARLLQLRPSLPCALARPGQRYEMSPA